MQEESNKQRELDKMKLLATSLLVCAFLIFVVASLFEEQYAWVGFVRATAEAAMVGALADWFAVTALFRYPLGLKIPHTAIIPTRKQDIGQNLGRFVRENFLTEAVIAAKLRSMEVTKKVAEWIRQPKNNELLADQMAVVVAALIKIMKDEDIQALIEHRLVALIRSTQFAPLLGNLLSLLLSGNRQQELFLGIVKLGSEFLKDNREVILERINHELPWWAPRWIDKQIYKAIVVFVDTTLQEVNSNPDHPLYKDFASTASQFIEDLKTSPNILDKEEAIKEELLQHAVVQEFTSSLWADIKTSLVEQSSNPDLDIRRPTQQMLARLAEEILSDPALYDKVDRWLTEMVIHLTKTYGYEVESLVSNTINNWDTDEITHKIEVEVGKDLQFIRINGTVIGGLAGLVIYMVSLLIKQG
jgi:uncharacterized membrane-anchored protein YjiN (DUF445 family)